MNIPNLPTDNLYKFTFLAGISIIVISVILYITEYNNLNTKTTLLRIAIDSAKTEGEFQSQDINLIKLEIDKIGNRLHTIQNKDTINEIEDFKQLNTKLLNDKNFRDYYGFVLLHQNELVPYQNQLLDLEIKNKELLLINRKQIINSKQMLLKSRILEKENISLFVLALVAAIVLVIGIKMSISGYNNWYNIVQKPLDKKLMIELESLTKE